ncbi:hypothetical protein QVD17_11445 [Tagetes erecta]|uniref:Uncharacterized protein n=1 Tax=Tagetes erecta TaxID=13708 RepID=A0AAD8KTG3_TARER|nr:hypothetical protein QVD17_11445 [Tagetes erecta]
MFLIGFDHRLFVRLDISNRLDNLWFDWLVFLYFDDFKLLTVFSYINLNSAKTCSHLYKLTSLIKIGAILARTWLRRVAIIQA